MLFFFLPTLPLIRLTRARQVFSFWTRPDSLRNKTWGCSWLAESLKHFMKLIKHQDLAQPHFPSWKHHPWLYHSWRSLCTLAGGWFFDHTNSVIFFFSGWKWGGLQEIWQNVPMVLIKVPTFSIVLDQDCIPRQLSLWQEASHGQVVTVRGRISSARFLHSRFSFLQPQCFVFYLSAEKHHLWHSQPYSDQPLRVCYLQGLHHNCVSLFSL